MKPELHNYTKPNGVLKGSVWFLVLCLCLLYSTSCAAFEGQVDRVIDGDTFVLTDGKVIRIAAIDTPEIGRSGKHDQYYAREAKELLTKLIDGKKVRVEYNLDRSESYKRIVGWVYVDNIFINEYMVRSGAAFYYYHKGNQRKLQNRILASQRKAYKARKGFWPFIVKQQAFRQSWVGNKCSKRAFPQGDRFGSRISTRNRVNFSNLGEGYLQGYSPARHVNFWPVVY